MNGVSLRLFPAVVPGGEGKVIYPADVDVDKEGRIWVAAAGAVRVVQYSKDGLPVATFDVPSVAQWYPRISVDARDNSIIVVASNEILMFTPNGSLDGSFGKQEGVQLQYATTDKDGNILVTDTSVSRVHVYDHVGQYSFSFDTVSVGKGKPRGICTDLLGHIFVADSANGRVDMFTSRGEFVRTVVNFTNPWAVAVGPGGQLVVTDAASVATIFPREMVFPDE
ncbi:protein wech-like [Branchiostoma floridae]|nr:protein wech-like [Branchiostoma floridae]